MIFVAHEIKGLTFRVGSADYSVVMRAGPLYHHGVEANACSYQSSHTIVISTDVEIVDRLRALVRELARVWTWEVGEPADADEWLTLCATVTASAMRDLLPSKSWKRFEPLASMQSR